MYTVDPGQELMASRRLKPESKGEQIIRQDVSSATTIKAFVSCCGHVVPKLDFCVQSA